MRHSPAGSVTPSHVVETDAEEIERRARQIFESKVDDDAEMQDFPEEAAAAEAEAEVRVRVQVRVRFGVQVRVRVRVEVRVWVS